MNTILKLSTVIKKYLLTNMQNSKIYSELLFVEQQFKDKYLNSEESDSKFLKEFKKIKIESIEENFKYLIFNKSFVNKFIEHFNSLKYSINTKVLFNLDPKLKISTLYTLFQNRTIESNKLFTLIKNTPNLKNDLMKIPANTLFTLIPYPNDSLFLKLLQNDLGCKFLHKLTEIKHKNNVLLKIPATTLFAVSKLDNSTPFYWLFFGDKEQEVLKLFLSHNNTQDLFLHVTHEALFNIVKARNSSAFFGIVSKFKFNKYLLEILIGNEKTCNLFYNIPQDALFSIDKHENSAPFFYLFATNTNIKLFNILYKHQATKKKLLNPTPSALFNINYASKYSALYLILIKGKDVSIYIDDLLAAKKSQNILEQVTFEALHTITPKFNDSPMHLMLLDEINLKLFTFFTTNKITLNTMLQIPDKNLFRNYYLYNDEVSLTLLTELANSKIGIKFLNLLIKKRMEAAFNSTITPLMSAYEITSSMFEYEKFTLNKHLEDLDQLNEKLKVTDSKLFSPNLFVTWLKSDKLNFNKNFKWLIQSLTFRLLLVKYFDEVKHLITAENFLKVNKETGCSAFFLILNNFSFKKDNLLKHLTEDKTTSKILHHITAETLFSLDPVTKESLLFRLCIFENGLKYLEPIINDKEKWKVFLEIMPKTLFTISQRYKCPLIFWMVDKRNLSLLDILLKHKQTTELLLNNITYDALFKIEPFYNTCTFFRILNNSKVCQQFIKLLFTNKRTRKLIFRVKIESLTSRVTIKHHSNSFNYCILLLLFKITNNHEYLDQLLNNKSTQTELLKISAKELFTPYNLTKPSLSHYLLFTKPGKKYLEFLLNDSKACKIFLEITKNSLFGFSPKTHNSFFYLMTTCDIGKKLFTFLFNNEKTKKLLLEVPKSILDAKPRLPKRKFSAFDNLKNFEAGKKFLQSIDTLEKNPVSKQKASKIKTALKLGKKLIKEKTKKLLKIEKLKQTKKKLDGKYFNVLKQGLLSALELYILNLNNRLSNKAKIYSPVKEHNNILNMSEIKENEKTLINFLQNYCKNWVSYQNLITKKKINSLNDVLIELDPIEILHNKEVKNHNIDNDNDFFYTKYNDNEILVRTLQIKIAKEFAKLNLKKFSANYHYNIINNKFYCIPFLHSLAITGQFAKIIHIISYAKIHSVYFDLNLKDIRGRTAFLIAIKTGVAKTPELKALITAENYNLADEDGFTPLMYAVMLRNIHAINLILEKHILCNDNESLFQTKFTSIKDLISQKMIDNKSNPLKSSLQHSTKFHKYIAQFINSQIHKTNSTQKTLAHFLTIRSGLYHDFNNKAKIKANTTILNVGESIGVNYLRDIQARTNNYQFIKIVQNCTNYHAGKKIEKNIFTQIRSNKYVVQTSANLHNKLPNFKHMKFKNISILENIFKNTETTFQYLLDLGLNFTTPKVYKNTKGKDVKESFVQTLEKIKKLYKIENRKRTKITQKDKGHELKQRINKHLSEKLTSLHDIKAFPKQETYYNYILSELDNKHLTPLLEHAFIKKLINAQKYKPSNNLQN